MSSWHVVFSTNEKFFAHAMLWVVVAQVLCFKPVFSDLPPSSLVADSAIHFSKIVINSVMCA
jgi:hypothetical protein